MRFWQKLTIDWPCALGDWLWAVLVVAPAAFLDRLTLRRVVRMVLQIALWAILLMYFEQIVSLDLTFLFAIDAATYLEIAAAIFVLVAQGHLRRALQGTARSFRLGLQNRTRIPLRFGTRQRRNTNAMRRKTGDGTDRQSDDEPAVWCGNSNIFASVRA
jgi:hypothetical protein